MAFLAVRQLRYYGENFEYTSPALGDGLQILEGPNGSGKSTFANLIYFGLGGRVESFERSNQKQRHREITNDKNNSVSLLVSINGSEYALKRVFSSNHIAVSGSDVGEVFPLNRGPGRERTFSDWILEKLEIAPVTIEHGTYSGVLNITDLMRLIYHNQEPDPTGIYKPADRSSFVTDSLEFRKAIFEVLIGQSYQEYYRQLARYRDAEREKTEASKALELFKEAVFQLGRDDIDTNVTFLEQELDELREQLERLTKYRDRLAKMPPKPNLEANISSVRSELLDVELESSRLRSGESDTLEELSRFARLRSDLILEATQIRKMMFSEETLGLFNSNTCPYCLNDVPRIAGKCICGRDVLETEYEKFFYNTEDYMKILKSRQKNVETVDEAIRVSQSSLERIRRERQGYESRAKELRSQLAQYIEDSDLSIDLAEFEKADRRIRDLKETRHNLEQRLELEKKRDVLENDLTRAKSNAENLKRNVEELRLAAEREIDAKKIEFSKQYFDMMKRTVSGCRSASLSSDYMPIINHGDYREASARVPQRLLYYATFLKLSRIDQSISFPRFLLIDTPETAGIDRRNLIKALDRLVEITTMKKATPPCQVILTTGEGKYPDEQADRVFDKLSLNEKLLRRRTH